MSWINLQDLERKPEITDEQVEEALEFASGQVIRNLAQFTHKFQKAYSEGGLRAHGECGLTPILDRGNLAGLRVHGGRGI